MDRKNEFHRNYCKSRALLVVLTFNSLIILKLVVLLLLRLTLEQAARLRWLLRAFPFAALRVGLLQVPLTLHCFVHKFTTQRFAPSVSLTLFFLNHFLQTQKLSLLNIGFFFFPPTHPLKLPSIFFKYFPNIFFALFML